MVASAARELLNKSDNERSGVLSTAMASSALSRSCRCGSDVALRLAHRRHRQWGEAARSTRGAAFRHQQDQAAHPPSAQPDWTPLTEDSGARRPAPVAAHAGRVPALGRLDFFESALAFMVAWSEAFLIAQSLNRSKAYGPNNRSSHRYIGVSFATNDERTAKRVSDALGTATEMRARRICRPSPSPWLGHDVAPGERPGTLAPAVMQLPSSDEVDGRRHPPHSRAQSRYHEDARLARIEPPGIPHVDKRPADDWSTRAVPERLVLHASDLPIVPRATTKTQPNRETPPARTQQGTQIHIEPANEGEFDAVAMLMKPAIRPHQSVHAADRPAGRPSIPTTACCETTVAKPGKKQRLRSISTRR